MNVSTIIAINQLALITNAIGSSLFEKKIITAPIVPIIKVGPRAREKSMKFTPRGNSPWRDIIQGKELVVINI